jgi:hypothetical protein
MALNSSITELDFLEIKNNLRDFLKGQDRFKDYNFEGSNLSVILDILAYNTFQNGFFTNMAMNEMFLDSALLRSSVVSHAKTLNYVPRSKISARAKINVTLSVNDAPSFVVIPSRTPFIAQCGNKILNFYNENAVTVTPVSGVYSYTGLEIYEGRYVQEYFNVTSDPLKCVITNTDVDTTSVKAYVKDSIDATVEQEYTLKTSIFGNTPDSAVFYIQSYGNNQYEVIFGLNTFGKQPSPGSIIRIEYRVTSGPEANDITSFAAAGNIQGYPITVILNGRSEGGLEEESIASVKYFAPRALQIQDRAITESDYEIILKNRFPEIQAISVYGGEELNPPRYGRVVIAIDLKNANGVSENNKAKYAAYLHERSPIGIEPIVISPEYMFMGINLTVYFNTKTTSITEADIKQTVLNTITKYNEEKLSDFKLTFRASNLSSIIDASDSNILSNDMEVLPIISLNPILGTESNYDVTFNNPLIINRVLAEGDSLMNQTSALRSSVFTYDGNLSFIQDNGKGVLEIIKNSGTSFTVLNSNVGSIDYDTGRCIIKKLKVSSFIGSGINLYAKTRTKTIATPKNRILSIRDEDISINVIGVS